MRRVVALASTVALLLGLGGCGGGDQTASTASTTSRETAAAPQPAHRSQARTDGETSWWEAKAAPAKVKVAGVKAEATRRAKQSGGAQLKPFKPVKVPPISAAPAAGSKAPAPGVKTVRGADNSVQEYGIEADQSARTAAAIALQGYLNARAQEDWPTACSDLAQKPKEQLEKFAQGLSTQGKAADGCAATLASIRETPSLMREQATIAEVLSFRAEGEVSGDPAYLIFSGLPANTLYSMPMYMEGGSWKVGLGRADELPVG